MQLPDYKLCKLFGLKSKRTLSEMLGIEDSFFNKKKIRLCTRIFLDKKNPKQPRIIETSYINPIKKAQRRILYYLQEINVPKYLYSGIKGTNFIENGKAHVGKDYVFKIDISKFFPNTSRNKVYCFFSKKLHMSPDVADILTDFTTVSVPDFANRENYDEIREFMKEKSIKPKAHLMTGSSASVLLSFLVNEEMFERINHLCKENNIRMTVYVDDMVFSSSQPLSLVLRKKICDIVRSFGYRLSSKKIGYYQKGTTKKITGTVLDKNGCIKAPNALKHKIHNDLKAFKDNPTETRRAELLGRVLVANSIDNSFSSLKKALKKPIKE